VIHSRRYWALSLAVAPAFAFIACNNEGEGPLPVIPPTATTVAVADVDAAAPLAIKDASDENPVATASDGAAQFGLIGLLHSGDSDGGMWGDSIGDSFGAGGLGLSGIGDGGGGGGGGGFGVGTLGSLGHGSGAGSSTPKVRAGAVTVTGKLPSEVIQRIVRQNFGRFRFCYEGGLRTNPKLAGTVSTRFVIGKDGAPGSVSNAGSSMSDPAVVQCVVSHFWNLFFPQPESGVVIVIFPIVFSPN
jgi:hypothetical protein